jgi:hypothetical protein
LSWPASEFEYATVSIVAGGRANLKTPDLRGRPTRDRTGITTDDRSAVLRAIVRRC